MPEKNDEINITESPKPRPPRRSSSKPFEPTHMKRKVKIYTVTESELNNVANDNTAAKWAFSTGCALFSFTIGLGASMFIEGSPSEISQSTMWIVIPVCAALSITSFAFWWMTREQRMSELKHIFDSAEEQEF